MVRHSSNASESWKALTWKKFRRDLFRLQRRVYKAVSVGGQAESPVTPKANLQIPSGYPLGNSARDATQRWGKDCGYRWQSVSLHLLNCGHFGEIELLYAIRVEPWEGCYQP